MLCLLPTEPFDSWASFFFYYEGFLIFSYNSWSGYRSIELLWMERGTSTFSLDLWWDRLPSLQFIERCPLRLEWQSESLLSRSYSLILYSFSSFTSRMRQLRSRQRRYISQKMKRNMKRMMPRKTASVVWRYLSTMSYLMVKSPKPKQMLPRTTIPQKWNTSKRQSTAALRQISSLYGRTVNTQQTVKNSKRKIVDSKPSPQKKNSAAKSRLSIVKMILLRLAQEVRMSPSQSLRQLSKDSPIMQCRQLSLLSPHFGFIAKASIYNKARVRIREKQPAMVPTARKEGSVMAPSRTRLKNCRLLKKRGKMKTTTALMKRLQTPTSQKIRLPRLISPLKFRRRSHPSPPVNTIISSGRIMATQSLVKPAPQLRMSLGLSMSMPSLIRWQREVFWVSWYMQRQQICRNSMTM